MEHIRLTEVLKELESGGRPKGGAAGITSGVFSFGGEHISADGRVLFEPKKYVPEEYFQEMRRGKVFKDDILVVKDGATTGKVGYVSSNVPLPAAINEHVFRIAVDSEKAFPKYVYYHLLSTTGNQQILLDFRGATVGGISQEFPDYVNFPLPPLPKQKRIAVILDKADKLRRLRRYALEMSETFLQSVFLEMFGDPVRNEKGWDTCELEELASVERGKFTPRPRNDPSYFGGSLPFIQTGDITNSRGRLSSWTQTLNEKGKKVSRSFPPGTVVIAIVGATIGVTAILEIEVYCPDSVVGIQTIPEKITKEYLEYLLRFWRPVFLAQAPETARANINLDTLRPLRIPTPPMTLQKRFTCLVLKNNSFHSKQVEALRQSEHLFQTLLHKFFTQGI